MIRKLAATFLFLVGFTAAVAAAVNVGVYALVSTAVTAALTAQTYTAVPSLDGAKAISLEANFQYGSGGTSLSVLAQTSCDGGTTYRDIVRFDFTTATRVAYANVSGLTAKNAGTYTALAAEGVNDGLICPLLRASITSVGAYVNTTVSLRASVR